TYPSMPLEQASIHAMTVLMFKLEGQLIEKHPEYQMEDRRLLHRIDWEKRALVLDDAEYELRDLPFPTVSPDAPYQLMPEEQEVLSHLKHAFLHSERLQRHVAFLYQKGHLYRVVNGNLLFHGCVPMTEAGVFAKVELAGAVYSGRSLMDHHEAVARSAFYQHLPSAVDFMWYLWCADRSPVCGRKIKTFERAFLLDQSTWEEPMDPYYRHCETEEGCNRVLREFELSTEESHIINGHTPIKVKEGESPIKAGGRLIVIDGGFCRSLQKRTGIAGYTLIANSHGLRISAHQPFTSIAAALEDNDDIHSDPQIFFTYRKRMMIADTDNGHALQRRIEMLEALLKAYRKGWLPTQER
ncbi:MAG: fructose-bisphosphatase class III, partial [Eubacteriales bacterium]|nr:fructose-bisphosphatase class III [Eubacteriales bacterium]